MIGCMAEIDTRSLPWIAIARFSTQPQEEEAFPSKRYARLGAEATANDLNPVAPR